MLSAFTALLCWWLLRSSGRAHGWWTGGVLQTDWHPPGVWPHATKHKSLSLEWSYLKLPNAQTCRKPNPLLLYQVIYSLVFIPSRSRHDHLERNPFSRPFPGFIVRMKIPTASQISNPIKRVSISSLNITLLRFCLGTARAILFPIFLSIFKPILDIKIGNYKWYVCKGVLLLFWRKISSSTPLQSGFSTWPLTGG